MGKRVSERATRGGEGRKRRCRDTAFTWCAWKSPRSQCGQSGFVLLELACSAARRLCEPACRVGAEVARRLTGPVAEGRGPGCGFASDRAIPPPSQAGVGFGLWLGSPVLFLAKLGRRGIKPRRKQGPTAGGVSDATWGCGCGLALQLQWQHQQQQDQQQRQVAHKKKGKNAGLHAKMLVARSHQASKQPRVTAETATLKVAETAACVSGRTPGGTNRNASVL